MRTSIERGDFHGWEALVLCNGIAAVTVVPALGRIMQMALVTGDQARGPLWRHPQLGPAQPPDAEGWINRGGDKAWPAPQAAWATVVGRAWPPPKTFDASPFDAIVTGERVELVSPVDPSYGLRVRRTITLAPTAPRLTVDSCFEKVAGPPVRVAVWTVTQLDPPDRLFLRLPPRSAFPGGFAQRLPTPPKDLVVVGRLLSLARDPAAKTMIVSDGDTLLWIGDGPDLLIEALPVDPVSGRDCPDGVHAQIYTSSDQALPYVELELLAPLTDLAQGQRACLRIRYTLGARVETDATAEARRVLGS